MTHKRGWIGCLHVTNVSCGSPYLAMNLPTMQYCTAVQSVILNEESVIICLV